MDEAPDLARLARMQPDPEVFRRVWNRVMPDQKDSPIVVAAPHTPANRPQTPPNRPWMPPAGSQAPSSRPAPMPGSVPPSGRPAKPEPGPRPPAPPAAQRPLPRSGANEPDGAEAFPALMDLTLEGSLAVSLLLRRTGTRNGSQLSSMSASLQQTRQRLSAAYFLETGRRYQPVATAPERSPSLPQALREQFLWEQKWERSCFQASLRSRDPSLQSLLQDLAEDGRRRARTIRSLLERIRLA